MLIRHDVATLDPCTRAQALTVALCYTDSTATTPQHTLFHQLPPKLLITLMEHMQFINCIGVQHRDNVDGYCLPHSGSRFVTFRFTRRCPTQYLRVPMHAMTRWYDVEGTVRVAAVIPLSKKQCADVLWIIIGSKEEEYNVGLNTATYEYNISPGIKYGRSASISASIVWHIEHVLCRSALHACNALRKLEPGVFVE